MEPALRRGRLERRLHFVFARDFSRGFDDIGANLRRIPVHTEPDGGWEKGVPRQQALASEGRRERHTPARATKVAHARPRATLANRIVLSRVHFSERPRREGDATVARENTRRLPERRAPCQSTTTRDRGPSRCTPPGWTPREGPRTRRANPRRSPVPLRPHARLPPTGACSEASSACPPRTSPRA